MRKVKCAAYDYKRMKWAEYDISTDFKLYPCCAYHGYYELNPWDKDNFANFPKDWNDLKKHSMKEIQTRMHSILNRKNFNKGTCPEICKKTCGVDVKKRTMSLRND